MRFRGGVLYRGSVKSTASGEGGKRITYRGTGWGEGRAVIDGSLPVIGWQKCRSAEEAGGSKHFTELYYVDVEAASPFLLNLHETDPRTGEDAFLWIAQDPNPKDPFFFNRTDSFHTVKPADLTATSVTAPEVFTQSHADWWEGASLLLWVNPNQTIRVDITGYDSSAHRVRFANIGKNALYGTRDQFFALYNNPYAIDQPGEYAVGKQDASGKRRVVLWPRSADSLDQRITRSVRDTGIDLNGQSGIEIDGFLIRKFAGEDKTEGCGIRAENSSVSHDLLIRNNIITHTMCGSKGYGGIYLSNVADSVVENNDVSWVMNHRGIFLVGGCENVVVRGNRISYTGATALATYHGKRLQFLDNTISHIYATHANAITVYIASENILVAGNTITDATNPITFQDSGPIYFINNYTDGGDAYKNVNEWPNTKRGPWATGEIVFLHNTFVNAEGNNALSLGKDPDKRYVVTNNILDGLAVDPKLASQVVHTHNLYLGLSHPQAPRYGWTAGDGEIEIKDVTAAFANCAVADYTPVAGGPADIAGKDSAGALPVKIFPDVATQVPKPFRSGPRIGAEARP